MKDIILFDTSMGTMNHGDEIIMKLFEKNGADLLEKGNVAKFPTHTPCFHFYQQTRRNPRYRFVKGADYKFICGTNLLSNKMYIPWHFFNVNIFNCKCFINSVLVGVGVSSFPKNSDKVHWYTKKLFSSFLSRTYKHSVRDERTKRIVESIMGEGSAINTGCPTVWGLTKEHCAQIPQKKAENVVFTLTDYAMDKEADQYLIDTLLKCYKTVYFWPQGTKDLKYFSSLPNRENIKVIPPSVNAYTNLLLNDDIEYVGTRLHAGIYALNHKKRAIILIVDNRAADMAETYNLKVINRNDKGLGDMIMSDFSTDININEEAIAQWKSQFTE